jgi:hypothetical protein
MKEQYIYIEENDGKPRWHVLVKCHSCGKDFYKPVRFAAITTNHYCDKDCHNVVQRKNQIAIVCNTCGKTIYVQPKRYKRSKTKTFYCDRGCKDKG